MDYGRSEEHHVSCIVHYHKWQRTVMQLTSDATQITWRQDEWMKWVPNASKKKYLDIPVDMPLFFLPCHISLYLWLPQLFVIAHVIHALLSYQCCYHKDLSFSHRLLCYLSAVAMPVTILNPSFWLIVRDSWKILGQGVMQQIFKVKQKENNSALPITVMYITSFLNTFNAFSLRLTNEHGLHTLIRTVWSHLFWSNLHNTIRLFTDFIAILVSYWLPYHPMLLVNLVEWLVMKTAVGWSMQNVFACDAANCHFSINLSTTAATATSLTAFVPQCVLKIRLVDWKSLNRLKRASSSSCDHLPLSMTNFFLLLPFSSLPFLRIFYIFLFVLFFVFFLLHNSLNLLFTSAHSSSPFFFIRNSFTFPCSHLSLLWLLPSFMYLPILPCIFL